MINTYCYVYEPVRNYLESPQSVIEQIDLNNAVYLEECMNE